MSSEIPEEMRQKLLEYQRLQEEAETIIKTLGTLEMALIEHDRAITTLKFLAETEGNVESLVNIGAGAFIHSRIKGKGSILVSIGGDVIVEKDVENAIKFLEERKDKIAENMNGLNTQINAIYSRMRNIQEELARSEKRE